MDTRPDEGPNSDAASRKRHRRWLAATAASVLVAGASAFAAVIGSKLANSVSSSSAPLISSYAAEETAGCGSGSVVFLPDRDLGAALAKPPSEESFPAFQSLPGFAFADLDRVNVSIQGESARPITLTGIYFHVDRRPRPKGAMFVDPCGGPTEGRTIVFDVGHQPPRVVESNVLLHVPLGSAEGDGRPLTRPIKFPWTVSLTDPLLLTLIATTKSACICSWTAEIPWVSGGKHGAINIDNAGEGYDVVSSQGLRSYSPGSEEAWNEQPPETYPPSAL